jgi:hypothetical protein
VNNAFPLCLRHDWPPHAIRWSPKVDTLTEPTAAVGPRSRLFSVRRWLAGPAKNSSTSASRRLHGRPGDVLLCARRFEGPAPVARLYKERTPPGRGFAALVDNQPIRSATAI